VPGQIKEELAVIPGNVPDLVDLPVGCRFAPRCGERLATGNPLAEVAHPTLGAIGPDHLVRCWQYHRPDGSQRPTAGVFDEMERSAIAAAARAAAEAAAVPPTGSGP